MRPVSPSRGRSSLLGSAISAPYAVSTGLEPASSAPTSPGRGPSSWRRSATTPRTRRLTTCWTPSVSARATTCAGWQRPARRARSPGQRRSCWGACPSNPAHGSGSASSARSPFGAADDRVEHEHLRRQRVREVLCVLVARRRIRREELAELVWPEVANPGSNLRTTLSYLRHVMEPDHEPGAPPFFVRADAGWLTLNAGSHLQADLWELDDRLDEADASTTGWLPGSRAGRVPVGAAAVARRAVRRRRRRPVGRRRAGPGTGQVHGRRGPGRRTAHGRRRGTRCSTGGAARDRRRPGLGGGVPRPHACPARRRRPRRGAPSARRLPRSACRAGSRAGHRRPSHSLEPLRFSGGVAAEETSGLGQMPAEDAHPAGKGSRGDALADVSLTLGAHADLMGRRDAVMPRYLVETSVVGGSHLDHAEGLLAHRFPEISVERRFLTDDDTTTRAIWVCRAPSDAHVVRWAASAELSITSMRRIAADTGQLQEA